MQRKSTRIPGDWDTEDDHQIHDPAHHLSSLLHASDKSTDLATDSSEIAPTIKTASEEHGLHNQLDDVESSFLPEFSHLAPKQGYGPTADDTYMFGVPKEFAIPRRSYDHIGDSDGSFRDIKEELRENDGHRPETPPGAYKTPAPEDQNTKSFRTHEEEPAVRPRTPDIPNTSSLETMSSSPTAAAAARTVSRAQSMATMGGYETADERVPTESPTGQIESDDDKDITPTKKGKNSSRHASPSKSRLPNSTSSESLSDRTSRRPKYLNSRSSYQRLSHSSVTSSTTEASDATLGADFALQSGGAVPEPRLQRKPKMTLSRSTSLGSIVSGISGMSDDEGKSKRPPGAPDLSTLEEENTLSSPAIQKRSPPPITPRTSSNNLVMPTDTVIANNVRDIEVPGTFARQYRQQQGWQSNLPLGISPDRNTLAVPGMTPGPSAKKGMTLKEHRSTVERLGKENFDLKMKIHFLDQALQRRSEDGIKEMITENVQLKSDRMRLEKDNHVLRKQVRELQRKLDGVEKERESPNIDQGYATDEERSPTAEEEVIYLRERVEMNEVEIEKLRTESIKREEEKRRLAEMVRNLSDTRAGVSDVGSREERDMWKDMLEAETIAREQSEEECRRLRDEIAKLRSESFGQGRFSRMKQQAKLGPGSVISRSSSTDDRDINSVKKAENAELERLRHEVLELQKVIGAQASTLTSRNKEKERLYQEIEDLKLGKMGAVRSVAGDSIFERSASRARSTSRASNGTRFSRASETERENFEAKINELRDQVSELKLENQNLKTQCDEVLAELDAVDAQAQADADQFNEELRILTQERDDALRDAEGQDAAFQQLKAEAQEEIDGLGDELDEKIEECQRLQEELKREAENVKALQAEMRSASEGLIRLEEDAQQNLRRYDEVRAELEEERREVERLTREVRESEAKIERLTVQQESGLSEIAFLREEQDGDKMKIGDLEGLLKKVHLNLDSEREKAKDLERRLAEERQQREALANQREQDVARVIDGLNREVAALREEGRKTRKQLNSREIEASTWKDRHAELEGGLKEVLGFGSGNSGEAATVPRTNLISHVTRMQRELDQTTADLDATRKRLDEKETLLANRDALLESSGLEYRKISDLLERERQARRQDKHSFEQSLKSHQQSARALATNNTKIADLEQARQTDRKKLAQLEQQYKEQLAERNSVLLTIWKKLSAMCGPDWTHNNSLINGNLPSQEVIGNILFWPGFSRNLLLATKQVEGTLSQFKDKIKRVERELWKEYQGLDHALELRAKKLERIEEAFERVKQSQDDIEAQHEQQTPRATRHHTAAITTPELQKLKGENRLLKAELSLLQQQHANAHYRSHQRGQSRSSGFSGGTETTSMGSGTNAGIPQRRSSMRGSGSGSGHGHTRQAPSSAHGVGGLTRSHTTNNVLDQMVDGVIGERRSNSMSTERSRMGELMVPAGPFNAPLNGNFAMPPHGQSDQQHHHHQHSHNPDPTGPPSNHSGSDVAGTVSSGANSGISSLGGVTAGAGGQEKWIHRLRELERRLKAEREARLLDRSGARRRLEERDAVNEELRLELERERMRREVGLRTASDDVEDGGM